ncbi:MAG: hypothetical protein OEZ48_03035 [Candidatus Bathyarchaeota archaeon]|nr:hypothetical protein [Candidatus Bathyarchaeota archaeon]
MVEFSIVNVVATASLGERVDLEKLGPLKEFLHDPDIYGGRVAYFKSSNMSGRVSVFASGKMISVGAKSEREAANQLEYAKEFLVKEGFVKPITQMKCSVRNVVAVANFGRAIDLEALARKRKMIYEPEQFPGGIIRLDQPQKATVLLFSSGKAVIAGLTSCTQIDSTLQKIMVILRERED